MVFKSKVHTKMLTLNPEFSVADLARLKCFRIKLEALIDTQTLKKCCTLVAHAEIQQTQEL